MKYITEEFLKRNGFVYFNNPNFDYYKHWIYENSETLRVAVRKNTLITRDERWFFDIMTNNEESRVELNGFFNYEHELKQALRLCRIKDLNII